MKKFLLAASLLVCVNLFGQNVIRFKGGSVPAPANISQFNWAAFSTSSKPFNGKRVALVQFEQTPSLQVRQQLQQVGVELVAYVPDKAYVVAISKPVTAAMLQQAAIRSIQPVPAEVKLSAQLSAGRTPAHAARNNDELGVMVSISKAFTIADVVADLVKAKITVVDLQLKQYHIISLQIKKAQLQQLAALPYVDYIQVAPPADKALNDEVRSNHRANVLQAPTALGGENLNGKGVVMGVGDNADLTTHIDLADRVINRAPFLAENHGVQTAGTAAGGGILDPLYKGIAPLATIISQVFSGILRNAAAYVSEFGMVVTNNSYGSITGECEYSGTYDLYSKVVDEQAFQLPQLLHVFAVGNDGPSNLQCNRNGYNSVLGGYQSSKNALDVAWGDKNHTVSPGSSYGPAFDGRLKPEITATGSDVRSPSANNNYITDWGSSMASPAVAGGAALLIEKYRQLNGGANPKSGLVKAWLMNGAREIEAAGPDYKSGFGWLNLSRSLDMLKNNRHFISTVTHGTTQQHSIAVPAGVTNLKVMLYWHDPAAAVFAAQALVNDLDLELLDPSSNTVLPWTLDGANVTAPATRKADHTNNVEQVTIAAPAAGNYTVRVKGTSINTGHAQEYFIVYDYTLPVVDLTFPSVGEPLVPGEQILVNWDAWDNSNEPFTLQYSTDNGSNWTTISSSIAASERTFLWTVPATITENAKMRLLRNNTSLVDESQPFAVIGQPAVSLAAVQCPTYAALQWGTVPGATLYEVMMKQGVEMLPVATTSSTSYTFSGLSRDSTYWFSVRAIINSKMGRRSVAVSRTPSDGSCTGAISDNDLLLDSIVSPNTGRKFTSTEITTTNLVVRIKNLDDVPLANFDVKYSINGGPFVTQTVSATIPAQGSYEHTFTVLNFTNPGTYNITAVVKRSGDVVATNDTARKQVEHLPNPPIDRHVENFETAPPFEVRGSRMGLPGLPQWDLVTTTPEGRARSFVQAGFAFNGSKAITLDVSRYIQAGNTNYLIGTFNFSNYSLNFPDELGLTLDFWFKNHGYQTSANNRVWARRSDTDPWIEVYNLDSAAAQWPGEWKYSGVIYLWQYIGQTTSSTQVRIGQQSVIGTADDEGFQGLTIDSLKVFFTSNDFGITRILAPANKGCALSSAETLTIETTGSRYLPTFIPVKYRLDGGPIVSEQMFGGIGTYSFANKLNLSAPGVHKLDVWIDFNQNGYRINDSIIGYTIINQPMVSTFPYFENFESATTNWYAEGHNSSWQLGTPASLKITKAASGTKAWKTSLVGSYNDNELSYLYSPCFNTSSLANPYLSFAMAIDMEQCQQSVCDAAWMEYSLDGISWQKLGAYGQGTNWYNRQGADVWDSAGFRRWHTASIPLPAAARLMLRLVVQSDGSLIKEGIAIDDMHVYDRLYPIYTSAPMSPAVVQNVSGNGFVHFVEGGKVLASINPQGNNLGATAVQGYINVGGFNNVRFINNQYYHNRNITIKPAQTAQPDSSIVRFYFTDAETDTLVRATGCATCAKPTDAYGLGITKYDDADDTKENGTLADNLSGVYSFIARNKITLVPYDNGYYAEFKVKDFSEFWLNTGGGSNNHLLPLQLQSFTLVKDRMDVAVQWKTLNEVNVERYEIEVAKGNAAFANGQFVKLGEVQALNRSQNSYAFTDAEPNKMGSRYYRLKLIDRDGSSRYSEVKLVTFTAASEWLVYPNPVKGDLTIVTQAEAGSKMEIRLLNAIGQVVWQQVSTASGQQDKLVVNTARLAIAPGVYMLQLSSGEVTKQVKVIKQ